MKVYFDARTDDFATIIYINAFCLVALLLVTWAFRGPMLGSKLFRRIVTGLLSFGLIACASIVVLVYRSVCNALNAGTCSVLEGQVRNFRPFSGNGLESFELQGRTFEYTEFSVTLGYHTFSSSGGPIREGRRIKVFAVGGLIVGLEAEAVSSRSLSQGPLPLEGVETRLAVTDDCVVAKVRLKDPGYVSLNFPGVSEYQDARFTVEEFMQGDGPNELTCPFNVLVHGTSGVVDSVPEKGAEYILIGDISGQNLHLRKMGLATKSFESEIRDLLMQRSPVSTSNSGGSSPNARTAAVGSTTPRGLGRTEWAGVTMAIAVVIFLVWRWRRRSRVT